MPNVIQATPTQAGLDALAAALVSPPAFPFFTAVRLLDVNENVIVTQAADFSPDSGAGFSQVRGTSVFTASSLTSDVHWFELMGAGGVVLTRAQVDPPLPAGVAISLSSVNTFAPGEL